MLTCFFDLLAFLCVTAEKLERSGRGTEQSSTAGAAEQLVQVVEEHVILWLPEMSSEVPDRRT